MAGVLPASAPEYRVHNCTAWPEAQGDPDIAGIGVIVGFMLSAVLTLVVVIFHYIFDIQRMHDNPVDRRFLDAIRSKKQKSRIGSAPEDAWSAAMEASVLMFSDIQATTGLAVMLGAYSQLPRGLNAYHWQIAISLAWFSSLTHLATLSSLRAYFLDRPKIAIYRATYMGILLVLLIVAYGTTGYVQQSGAADQSSSWPAECLFSGKNMAQVEKNNSDSDAKVGGNNKRAAPFNAPLILFSIAFLLISYVTRVVRISCPLARSARRLLKEIPRRRLRRWYAEAARRAESDDGGKWSRAFRKRLAFVVAVVYILLKASYDLEGSMVWEITWLVAALAWGILRLVGLRYKASLVPIIGENTWTFGQILPVILAVFPLCTIFTTFYNKKAEQRKKNGAATGMNPIVNGAERQVHDRPFRQDETIQNLDVADRVWFPKLLGLLFGLALFLIGTCLFNFPAAPINKGGYWNTDKLADGYAMGTLLVQYFVLVGICGFEVVVFIAVCLTRRSDSRRPRPFMARKFMSWVLIAIMVAATALFIWGFRRLLGLHHGDTFL